MRLRRHRHASVVALLVLPLLTVPASLVGCGGRQPETQLAQRELPPPDPRAVRQFVEGVRLMKRGGRANERKAIRRFELALQVDANLWEARYNLGVLARRSGDLSTAIEHFEAALATQPGSAEALLALAEARHGLGEHGAAGKLLASLVAGRPDALEARVALAAILREKGDHKGSLEQAREVLIRDPSNVRALAEVGRVYLDRKRHDVAALVFQKALALTGDADPHFRAQVLNDMGLLELARGDTQLAFEHFAKAIHADPKYAPAHMNQGSVLLNAGDYQGARAEYEAVIRMDPKHRDARVALGAALRGLGQHQQARKHYEQVLDDAPHHPAALFNLAVLKADFLDQRPAARPLFERYLRVAPKGDPQRRAAERYLQEIPAPGGGDA
jgi:tetratricopeptide (TPR) repeat protein